MFVNILGIFLFVGDWFWNSHLKKIAHIKFVISPKNVLRSEDSIRNSWCLFTPIMVRFDQLTNKKRDVKAQNHNAQPWGEEMQDARWWQSPYNAYLPNVEYMYISLYNARSNIECKILCKILFLFECTILWLSSEPHTCQCWVIMMFRLVQTITL